MLTMLVQSTLTDGLARLREGFHQEGDWAGWIALWSVVLVPLLVFAAARGLRVLARRQNGDHPGRLFAALVRELGLTPAQRRLLHGLAKELRLQHPVTMLLSPKLFREYVGTWKQESSSRRSFADDDVVAIGRRLTCNLTKYEYTDGDDEASGQPSQSL